MIHVIGGLIALILGIWAIVTHWWTFWDLIWVVLPLLLVFGGAVAVISGLSGKKG